MKKVYITESQCDFLFTHPKPLSGVKERSKPVIGYTYFDSIFTPKNNTIYRRTLNEGLFKTFPATTVVSHLKKTYHLTDSWIMFSKYDYAGYVVNIEDTHISVTIPKAYDKPIIKSMSMCGWFLAQENDTLSDGSDITNLETGEVLEGFCLLQFEPIHQDTISGLLKKFLQKNTGLWVHLTPSIYVPKILKQGLCPSSKNNLFNYPDRIYLFAPFPEEEAFSKAFMLFEYQNNKEYKGEYSILTVKLDDDIPVYKDNNAKNAVYITDNVRPENIKEVGRITIDNKTIENL